VVVVASTSSWRVDLRTVDSPVLRSQSSRIRGVEFIADTACLTAPRTETGSLSSGVELRTLNPCDAEGKASLQPTGFGRACDIQPWNQSHSHPLTPSVGTGMEINKQGLSVMGGSGFLGNLSEWEWN